MHAVQSGVYSLLANLKDSTFPPGSAYYAGFCCTAMGLAFTKATFKNCMQKFQNRDLSARDCAQLAGSLTLTFVGIHDIFRHVTNNTYENGYKGGWGGSDTCYDDAHTACYAEEHNVGTVGYVDGCGKARETSCQTPDPCDDSYYETHDDPDFP